MTAASGHTATLYRMVMAQHLCPFGLKARHLLRRAGFAVEDEWLTSREEVDAFKAKYGVKTTPQVFIDGERIGGYDDLRRRLGKAVPDPKAVTYKPVIAVFAITALLALAVSYAASRTPFTLRALGWFIAFSMCVLAILKLQNLETFTGMFLGYDLLARRWVPYAYFYPFAEALAGILMAAGALTWLSAPTALFIGGVGAVSVFKAVYIDRRDLKCACVGGGSNVPLGFVSLTENLMMVAMAVAMLATPLLARPDAGAADPMAGMAMSGAPAADAALMAGMAKMSQDMNAPMSGDADADFVTMMRPHHQGAIDMARAELQFGKDPELRALADAIVKAQEKEIAEMTAWQARNAK
jgi:glutaredoxin